MLTRIWKYTAFRRVLRFLPGGSTHRNASTDNLTNTPANRMRRHCTIAMPVVLETLQHENTNCPVPERSCELKILGLGLL
jgi:hypothetical protein